MENQISKINSPQTRSPSLLSHVIQNINEITQNLGPDEKIEIKSQRGKTSVKLATQDKVENFTIITANQYREATQIQVDKPLSREGRASLAKKLYKEGKTQAEIANIVGCSQKTISNDLNKKK